MVTLSGRLVLATLGRVRPEGTACEFEMPQLYKWIKFQLEVEDLEVDSYPWSGHRQPHRVDGVTPL